MWRNLLSSNIEQYENQNRFDSRTATVFEPGHGVKSWPGFEPDPSKAVPVPAAELDMSTPVHTVATPRGPCAAEWLTLHS